MSHAGCLADHESTGLVKGDKRSDGHYYRCLRDNEVKRIYRDDDARYGHRVRPDKWLGWSDRDQEDGLSVTDAACAKSVGCAIFFHHQPEKFRHVVRIDLSALSEEIGLSLTAIFDPVENDPQNPCHFFITTTDVSIDDLLVSLREFMADDFPPPPKMPVHEPAISRAREARERYDRVFEIVCDVRGGPAP